MKESDDSGKIERDSLQKLIQQKDSIIESWNLDNNELKTKVKELEKQEQENKNQLEELVKSMIKINIFISPLNDF